MIHLVGIVIMIAKLTLHHQINMIIHLDQIKYVYHAIIHVLLALADKVQNVMSVTQPILDHKLAQDLVNNVNVLLTITMLECLNARNVHN